MKFLKKYRIPIIFILLLLSTNIYTQDVESEVILLNIYNNITSLMSSSLVTIRLVQNQQEVNKTNKFVGNLEITTKPSNNTGKYPFDEEILNFGKKEADDKFSFDLRYILGCSFQVKDDSPMNIVKFQAISKESTSQHVFDIELKINKIIKIDSLNTYFRNSEKICIETQKVMDYFKDELEILLNKNFKLKKCNVPSVRKLKPDEITDPEIRTELSKLNYTLNTVNEKIKENKEKKNKLTKRSLEIIKKIEEQSVELGMLKPKNKTNEKNFISANKTIEKLKDDLKLAESSKNNTEKTIENLKPKIIECETHINILNELIKENKPKLNLAEENNKKIKKQIADGVTKIENLSLEMKNTNTKLNELNKRLEDLRNQKKDTSSSLDTLNKNINTLQTELKTLEIDNEKFQKAISDGTNKAKPLISKLNDLNLKLNTKQIQEAKNNIQGLTSQMQNLENNFQNKKKDLMEILDKQFADIIDQASAQLVDTNNFDEQSWIKIFDKIPENVWKFNFK